MISLIKILEIVLFVSCAVGFESLPYNVMLLYSDILYNFLLVNRDRDILSVPSPAAIHTLACCFSAVNQSIGPCRCSAEEACSVLKNELQPSNESTLRLRD